METKVKVVKSQKVPLVLSEISALWNEYMGDISSICVFRYFLNNVQDQDTRLILNHALDLSEQHIKEKKKIMKREDLAIPVGFGEDDVNINAPRLFTDPYYLFYLSNISSFGMEAYALVLRYTTRPDIREHFSRCLAEAKDLFNKVVDIQMKKGQLVKVPRAEVEKEPVFPKDDSVISGLLDKNPRPMYAREVLNTFSGSLMDVLLKATATAFAQVVESKAIKDYMLKGKKIFAKHFEGFNSKLRMDDLPAPSTYESYITDSKVSPFSDKLMMYIIQDLCYFGLMVDSSATTFSLRTDLTAMHLKYGSEIAKYARDGLKIMINNGWFEQSPQIIRHDKL